MASPTRQAPSVKRLMREAKSMAKAYDPDGDIHAAPLGDGDNLFDWHFTIRGPQDTPFENGLYHGRLLFPPDYPMKPPEIFLLNTSGRFETNTKICLSISGYHPETWLPSWSVQTALIALQAFFITDAKGAIGGINWPEEARRCAAMRTHDYVCKSCGKISDILNIKIRDGVKSTPENSKSPEKKSTKPEKETEVEVDANNNPKITNTSEEKAAPPAPDASEDVASPDEKDASAETERQARLDEIKRRRQEIEMQMLKSRQDFQRNDLISLVFTLLTLAVICFLVYRRYNNNMDPITYTEEL